MGLRDVQEKAEMSTSYNYSFYRTLLAWQREGGTGSSAAPERGAPEMPAAARGWSCARRRDLYIWLWMSPICPSCMTPTSTVISQ